MSLMLISTGNGGTIELLYMQLYAPTTLAPTRDFWLLHYMLVMEDGSLMICERLLNNTHNGPSIPPVQHFVRAKILPNEYLTRPCEGGGSIIHIVDHIDLEVFYLTYWFHHRVGYPCYNNRIACQQPWSVPEVTRPLYESSTLLAQKTTMAISHEVSQPTITI
ncbi:homeobox-leucine zipper protein ATHB-8-like isoform X2 [Coffea arabica]|uniref:Homeobox-leucine zipper protein ATHB-8-like isoform X2 n=1 Tax=Coffea arabica TaxID=13443 RepID=A0ABM4X893_COFAR